MVAIFKVIISAALLASASAAAIQRLDASSVTHFTIGEPVLAIPDLLHDDDNTTVNDSDDSLDLEKRAAATSTSAPSVKATAAYGVLQVDEPVLATRPAKVTTTTKVQTTRATEASSSVIALPTVICANSPYGTLIVGEPVLAVRPAAATTKAAAATTLVTSVLKATATGISL